MEVRYRSGRKRRRQSEQGISLIEMMIAMLVLLVGIIGNLALLSTAVGGNFKSKQQSNSTAIAQILTEKIMSIPANQRSTLTITDCANLSSTVSTATGGSPLLSSGDVDFTQPKVPNYSMSFTDCGSQDRLAVYDVRWNVQTFNGDPYVKILTVSAKLQTNGTTAQVYSLPVTIRSMVGQGT